MKNLSRLLCAAVMALTAGAVHASTILYQYSLVSGTVSESGLSDLTSTSGTFSLSVNEDGNLIPATGDTRPTSLSPFLSGFQTTGLGFTPGLSGFVTPLAGDSPAFRVSFLLLEPVTLPAVAEPASLLTLGTPTSPAPQSVPLAVMPIPAALPLLAAGFGVLGLVGFRRRKAQRVAA